MSTFGLKKRSENNFTKSSLMIFWNVHSANFVIWRFSDSFSYERQVKQSNPKTENVFFLLIELIPLKKTVKTKNTTTFVHNGIFYHVFQFVSNLILTSQRPLKAI